MQAAGLFLPHGFFTGHTQFLSRGEASTFNSTLGFPSREEWDGADEEDLLPP